MAAYKPPGLGPDEVLTACKAVQICQEIDYMIDFSMQALERCRERMRKENNPNDKFTKSEIRTLEGKLIKNFSHQLATKAKLSLHNGDLSGLAKYPCLDLWLKVVGISKESRELLEQSYRKNLNALMDNTSDLNRLLLTNSCLTTTQRSEEHRRLSRALQNLRRYTDNLIHGNDMVRNPTQAGDTLELYWESWDNMVAKPNRHDKSSAVRNHIARRDESASPKQDTSRISDNSEWANLPSTPSTTKTSIPKVDSAASSLSSCSTNPPPSPGIALSPPSRVVLDCSHRKVTPPTTPPNWSAILTKEQKKEQNNSKFPTTPPPVRKHSTGIQKSDCALIKSQSHESDMNHRIGAQPTVKEIAIVSEAIMQKPVHRTNYGAGPTLMSSASSSSYTISSTASSSMRTSVSDMPLSGAEGSIAASSVMESSHTKIIAGGRQRRLPTEPILDMEHSPMSSPKSPLVLYDDLPNSNSTLQVPRSPRTPRSMGHLIRHRFTKTFKPGKCDLCLEFFIRGLKCMECKYRCHRECEPQVPHSCGLPEEFVNFYVNQMQQGNVPNMPSRLPQNTTDLFNRMTGIGHVSGHPAPFDSSSNTSSCNSSTPSSPAVMVVSTPPHSASYRTKFTFPEPIVVSQPNTSNQKPLSPNPIIDSVKSNDSDKTLSGSATSGSSGSAGTAVFRHLESQDSTASDGGIGRQSSISNREWDIPFDDLEIKEPIGTGRFSSVFRGKWHGDVAIRIIEMKNMEDEAALEAFRSDVATFTKTRHENVVLFMGSSQQLTKIDRKLAIVTSLCKGESLYHYLHIRKDNLQMNKIVILAQQIAIGMDYLHSRNIVHKDLKTKNIFLENGKAIITDFGLVNVTRRLCARQVGFGASLAERERMSIPKGWLQYLSPEIMQALRVQSKDVEDLPFTVKTDVYAFGTVWYELLTGQWPWSYESPETIIWMVGKGCKPALAKLSGSCKDIREVLFMCWNYKADRRPDFKLLSDIMEKIPKKRLARSPSHPIHLTKRSAESAF